MIPLDDEDVESIEAQMGSLSKYADQMVMNCGKDANSMSLEHLRDVIHEHTTVVSRVLEVARLR